MGKLTNKIIEAHQQREQIKENIKNKIIELGFKEEKKNNYTKQIDRDIYFVRIGKFKSSVGKVVSFNLTLTTKVLNGHYYKDSEQLNSFLNFIKDLK